MAKTNTDLINRGTLEHVMAFTGKQAQLQDRVDLLAKRYHERLKLVEDELEALKGRLKDWEALADRLTQVDLLTLPEANTEPQGGPEAGRVF